MSRTSTSGQPNRGRPGSEPSISFLTMSIEAEKSPAEDRADHRAGADRDQLQRAALARMPVPRRALGDHL